MPEDNPLKLPSENNSGNKDSESKILKFKDGHWLDWQTCDEENYYPRLLLGGRDHSLITDEMVKVHFEAIKKYWDDLYELVDNGNASVIKKTHPGIDLDGGFDRVSEAYSKLNTKNGRDEYDKELYKNRISKGKSELRSSLESKVKEKSLSAESESQLYLEKNIIQYLNQEEITEFVEEYLGEYGIKRASFINHPIDPAAHKTIHPPPNYRIYITIFFAAIFFIVVLLSVINLNHKSTSSETNNSSSQPNPPNKIWDSIAIEQSKFKSEQEKLQLEKTKAEAEKAKFEAEVAKIQAQRAAVKPLIVRIPSNDQSLALKREIPGYLQEGVDYYNNQEYKLCIEKMKEVLKRDKGNRIAMKYMQDAQKNLDRIYDEFQNPEILNIK
ncbi:MAG: hypothetical protein WCK85_06255 [Chlorobium sp.]